MGGSRAGDTCVYLLFWRCLRARTQDSDGRGEGDGKGIVIEIYFILISAGVRPKLDGGMDDG